LSKEGDEMMTSFEDSFVLPRRLLVRARLLLMLVRSTLQRVGLRMEAEDLGSEGKKLTSSFEGSMSRD